MRYIKDWEKWLVGKSRKEILAKLKELHEIIEIDELTSLYNRRAFNRELKFSQAGYKRYKTPFCVVNFDLKKFKVINDTYGHSEGDGALIFFANFLNETIRQTDLAFRVGGDEFVVILNHTGKKEGEQFLNRFYNSLKEKKDALPEGSVSKLVNANYSLMEWRSKDNVDDFLRKLDVKMFEQKRS